MLNKSRKATKAWPRKNAVLTERQGFLPDTLHAPHPPMVQLEVIFRLFGLCFSSSSSRLVGSQVENFSPTPKQMENSLRHCYLSSLINNSCKALTHMGLHFREGTLLLTPHCVARCQIATQVSLASVYEYTMLLSQGKKHNPSNHQTLMYLKCLGTRDGYISCNGATSNSRRIFLKIRLTENTYFESGVKLSEKAFTYQCVAHI